MSGIFDKAQEGIKKMSEVPKGKTRAPSGRLYDRPTTPEGWRALEEAEARLSGAKAEGSSRKAVSAGVGKKANTERTVTRESREADAQSKKTQDAVHGFGPIKAAEEFFDNLLYPKKAKGKREGGDFFNPPQAKASEDENNPVSFLVGGAASVYDDATNQIPADARIAMAPDSTVKERAGAVTNVALRTLNVAASVAPSIGVALKMSPKAVKGLIKAAKAGDAGALAKIERAISELPEKPPIIETPKPKSIAEAVEMSEPSYEFRPRTDPKSGRTLTTEANLDEHLTQSIEELSPPKTIAEAVARVEDPMADALKYREARNVTMDRFQGTQTDDIAKLDPDDARFDLNSDKFDEALTAEAYRKATGKDDYDFTPYDDVKRSIREWLQDNNEKRILETEDVEFLDSMIVDLADRVRNTSSKSGAQEWRRAVQDRKTGNWRPMGKSVRMVNISNLPLDVQRMILARAEQSTGVKYMTEHDWAMSKNGTKPRIVDSAEMATLEGFADDMGREGAHKFSVVPAPIVEDIVKDLRLRRAAQIERDRPASPLNVEREVSAQNPPKPPPEIPDEMQTSARQADLQVDRVRLAQDLVEKGEPRKWEQLLKDAVPEREPELIHKTKGWTDGDNADAIVALAKLKKEHKDLLQKASTATGDELDTLGHQIQGLENRHEALTEAMFNAGSEQGRALASRKLTLDDELTLLEVKTRAKIKKGAPLTPKEEERFAALVGELEKAEEKLLRQRAKAKMAEDPVKTARTPTMKREELDVELAQLKKEFLASSAKMSSGLDPEMFVILGKMASNRVKWGVASVDELIAIIKANFREMGLPEPDDTDILKAYAGESKPKTTRPPSMLAQAKRELALIEKRDALLEGVEKPSSPKAERVKSRRIQALEDEIAAIQEAQKPPKAPPMTKEERAAKAKATREQNQPLYDQAYKEKLRAEIAEMEAGTYTPKSKGQRALDREAELLKAKRDLMKDQIRKAIDAGKPKNPFEVVNTVLNIPRSSMASMDVSYGGRQGWLGLFNDPGSWVKGWGDQSAAMFRGEDHAMAVYNATVRDNPNLAMYKKMKLHLNTPDGSLASGEEAMRGNILARVGWRKFNPWRSSDRGFNAFANTQRTGMADTFVNRAKKWKGAELTKEEYEQLGHTINTLTGRGGTSIEAFNKAAEFLSFGLFSPRFLASRIEVVSGVPMWGTLFRRNVSPQVKALVAKEWAQSMGGVATVVTGLYYGAQLAFKKENVRFVSDPTSTDFGKVIVKDPNSSKETRIDTAAGMLQPIVLASKFKQLKRMKADGKSVDLVNDYGESLEREAGKFFRSKLNPAFGMMWNLGTGKDMTGKEYDWKNAARDMTIPLTEKEMIEGLVEDGWNRSDALGFLNLIGITTNAYGNDKPKKGPSGPKGATKLPRPGQ